MFDFLRSIGKSAEEKRQERLNAYLDGALSARDLRQFEQELARDDALRQELEQLQWVKLNVQQLPRVRAPRNFVLDPAIYGQKQPSSPGWNLYPGLRVATALTAFFLVLALALDVVTPYGALPQTIAGISSPQTIAEQAPGAAEDALITSEAEMAAEAPREPEGEGAAETMPFAATEEGEAARNAQEIAGEMAEEEAAAEETGPLAQEAVEEAAEAEEPVEEAAADRAEEPRPEPTSAPGMAEPAAGLDEAAEATAASDTAALAPPEPTTRQTESAPAPLAMPTETPPAVAAAEAADAAQTGAQTTPFPLLLVIEVLLVAALVSMALVTLLMRRRF